MNIDICGKIITPKIWDKMVYDYYKQFPNKAPQRLRRYPITLERVKRQIDRDCRQTVSEKCIGAIRDMYYGVKDFVNYRVLGKKN